MKPIILDADGHIEINDSMSDELKEKIMQYNSYANAADVDDETISEEEVDAYTAGSFDDMDESTSYESDGVETLEPEVEETSVSEEDLNNLNDLFS